MQMKNVWDEVAELIGKALAKHWIAKRDDSAKKISQSGLRETPEDSNLKNPNELKGGASQMVDQESQPDERPE